MLSNRLAWFMVMLVLLPFTCCLAQKADFAVTVGGTFTSDATGSFVAICPPGVPSCGVATANVTGGHRIYVEMTPAARLLNLKVAALYLELPFAAIPSQTLHLTTDPSGVSAGHLSSLFVTPALKLKLLPGGPVNPFVSLGGGWAVYVLDNGNNTRGALQFGGGVDLRTGTRHLRFRAEIRDFVTAHPNFGNAEGAPSGFNTFGLSGLHRNNVLLGGGIVLNF
jgi:hypothetical protein